MSYGDFHSMLDALTTRMAEQPASFQDDGGLGTSHDGLSSIDDVVQRSIREVVEAADQETDPAGRRNLALYLVQWHPQP